MAQIFYDGYDPAWVLAANKGPPLKTKPMPPAPKPEDKKPTPIELKVPFCCEGCQENIREALIELDGVDSVKLDPDSEKVTITGKVKPEDALKEAKKVVKRSEMWPKKKEEGKKDEKKRDDKKKGSIFRREVPIQDDAEDYTTTVINPDSATISMNIKEDRKSMSLVEMPQSSVRYGSGSKMLELFVTAVNHSCSNGYFLSNEWIVSLGKLEREELVLVLGRNGYIKIYETRSTAFYERMEEHMQVPGMDIDQCHTPENKYLCFRDENEVEELDDGVASRRMEQTKVSAIKHDGDLTESGLSEVSLNNTTQVAGKQTSATSPGDSATSLLEKREMPLTYSKRMLMFLKTAVKDNSSSCSYAVSTHWLSTLNDHQMEGLNSVLSEAGYSEIYKTSTTTYFERIQGRVRSCPIYGAGTVSTSGRNSIGSDTESLVLFQGHGKALAADHGSNVGGKHSFVVVEENVAGSKTSAKCLCAPLRLSVSVLNLHSTPSGPSSSSQGEDLSMFSSRQQVGDCYVSLPNSGKGRVIATAVDKDIQMKMFTFADGYAVSEGNVSVNVLARSSLMCCLRSDDENEKIKIEFSKIGGEAKMDESAGPLQKALAMGSMRTNVHACIVDSDRVEDPEEISLYLEEEYTRSPWRRDLEGGVWLTRSGINPKDSALESLTLELKCKASNRVVADRKACSREAHCMSFAGPPSVTMEGVVFEDLNRNSFLHLQIRYQVEISLPKPCAPLPPAGTPFLGTIRREPEVIDFDGVLQIRTESLYKLDSVQ